MAKGIRKVSKLENGLLKLDAAPEYLRNATEHNASKSRLLQLPTEIRSHIFSYVLGGKHIFLDRSYNTWGLIILDSTTDERCKKRDLIRLPRVCRQIYAETATVIYQSNVFVIHDTIVLQSWIRLRLPAQRETLRAIQPGPKYLSRVYWGDMPTLTATFPNLQELHVEWRLAAFGRTQSRFRELVIAHEGKGIRVIFA